jgi:beta-glucanase (GH16 family)
LVAELKRLSWCLLAGLLPSLGVLDCAASTVADPIWAVNIGGAQYHATDGSHYAADESIAESSWVRAGERERLDTVLGSQDPELYHSYRRGRIAIQQPIANGRYVVTLHFAEPESIGVGERQFDVFLEGQRISERLDVMLMRDGKTHSALSVSIPDVIVNDGALDLELLGIESEPILSAINVRPSKEMDPRWELVWSDEFDLEGAPDKSRWQIDEWPARVVNDEDQAYTARARNLRVQNGALVIEAHREDYENAAYTSARIHSQGLKDILYGRVDVRAKVPVGQGTWAAAWMLPSAPFHYATTCEPGSAWQGVDDCDAWPNSGEIDILEHVGYQPGHIHGTVHNRAYYWANWQQRKGRILIEGIGDRFHTYSVEWFPERIDLFVDEQHYFSYANENEGWQAWPYDQAFHVILNLAIGGAWGRAGGDIDDSVFPQRMLVDYVRVYEFSE